MSGARPIHYIHSLVANPKSTKELTQDYFRLGLIETSFLFVAKNNLFRSKVNYRLLLLASF